ncbi:MAG: polyprenyl synthetase family protein [Phycisphaerales bacterium]
MHSAASTELAPPSHLAPGPADPPAHLLAPVPTIDAFMLGFVRTLSMPENLRAAVEYALLGGGKRLRPVLAWHACVAAGGKGQLALPAAAAVEFVHAFSLVHDDLPGLDNDDLRRGRPTLHKATSDAMAILAGDALLNLAFQVLTDGVPDGHVAARLVAELASGTGCMIAGQVYDTLGGFAPGRSAEDRLRDVHLNKTGALIRASCRMGAQSAAADRGTLDRLSSYGDAVGLMFQIVDDIIDVTQPAEHVGKKTNKDHDAGKLTYPGVLGLEASRREVDRQLAAALSAIEPLGAPARPLAELATYMAVRTR